MGKWIKVTLEGCNTHDDRLGSCLFPDGCFCTSSRLPESYYPKMNKEEKKCQTPTRVIVKVRSGDVLLSIKHSKHSIQRGHASVKKIISKTYLSGLCCMCFERLICRENHKVLTRIKTWTFATSCGRTKATFKGSFRC